MVATATNTPAPAQPARVRVHVKLDRRTEAISISSTHPVGRTVNVIAFLPTSAGRRRAAYLASEQLEYAIRESSGQVQLVDWQDAIAAEIISRMEHQDPEETEQTIATIQPAYLALGSGLFRLQPVGIANTSASLKALRKKNLAECRLECGRLLDEARRNSQGIVLEAQRNLAKAKEELARAKAQAPPPPQWCLDNGWPVRSITGRRWQVAISFQFQPVRYEYTRLANATIAGRATTVLRKKVWNAIPRPPINCICWASPAEDGSYVWSQTQLTNFQSMLPHMHYSGACMEPGMAPSRIINSASASMFGTAITRCFKVVDLGSLLIKGWNWQPDVSAFCPPALFDVLRQEDFIGRLIELPCDSSTDQLITEHDRETFSAT